MAAKESKNVRCVRVAFQMGYRVTEEGGVIAPSGRSLITSLGNRGYHRFRFTAHVADREEHGLPRVIGVSVHRLAAYQLFGEAALQLGIQTRHLNGDGCDNRLANIAIGTASDNAMDKPENVRKAAATKAFRSKALRSFHKSRRKLTDDQVREIRDRFGHGESARTLGKAFAVDHGAINGIMCGRSYKDVK